MLQQVYLTVTNTVDTRHAQTFFSDDATSRLRLQWPDSLLIFRSSGTVRSVNGQFVTVVLGQHVGRIFKGQDIQ